MFDLTPDQQSALHAAILQQDTAIGPDGTLNWEQLDGAILLRRDHYLYQYRVSRSPLRLGYKYLSPQTLAQVFHLEAIDSGWMNGHILRTGRSAAGDWAVLWIPRQKRFITIAGAGPAGTDLTLTVPLPALVWAGINQDYWLWAVSESAFDPKAQALRPPLPNVYGHSGKICWGTNVPPVATAQTLPQAWQAFITSPFSGHEIHGKSGQYPKNVIRQLKAVANRRTYPINDLHPMRSYANTIDSLLTQALDL
jgi:PRTRC genetic system protein B